MKKEPLVFIEHIVDSIEKIEMFMKGISKENFQKNIQLQDALVRRIEIIGEAVKNLPKTFKDGHLDIPWIKIAGMRDKLNHHYFGVDLEVVWKTVNEDIPLLKRYIKKILKKEKFDKKKIV